MAYSARPLMVNRKSLVVGGAGKVPHLRQSHARRPAAPVARRLGGYAGAFARPHLTISHRFIKRGSKGGPDRQGEGAIGRHQNKAHRTLDQSTPNALSSASEESSVQRTFSSHCSGPACRPLFKVADSLVQSFRGASEEKRVLHDHTNNYRVSTQLPSRISFRLNI
jgi:hypothetical protein